MWWSETAQRHEVPTAVLRNLAAVGGVQLPYVKCRTCVPRALLLPAMFWVLLSQLDSHILCDESLLKRFRTKDTRTAEPYNTGAVEPRNPITPEQ